MNASMLSYRDKGNERHYLFWYKDDIYKLRITQRKNNKYLIDFSHSAGNYGNTNLNVALPVLKAVRDRVHHHAIDHGCFIDDYEWAADEKRNRVYKRLSTRK